MTQKFIKIFDDLEPFETRFEGTFHYDAEKKQRVYNGRGLIFDDQILYSIHFTRDRIDKNTYSETPTNIRGHLQFGGEYYKLTDVYIDRKQDEFLLTFMCNEKAIQLDCEIADFKFRCEYLGK